MTLDDENLGCGSSREQAASCLNGHGLMIVASDFTLIFLQNHPVNENIRFFLT
ncbi:MAG: hypothetical protein KBB56_04960 [Acidobacteria bacterium]|nr:hypothetical protein [Acidobacteriota bacterium]NMC95903.1 hypothetical protein [Deltaproteobacteria bacterium]